MSDIPDHLIPDGPQRIGAKTKYEDEIGGAIFPVEPGPSDTEDAVCDWCGEHKSVFLGVDAETHEPRRMCLMCRIQCACSPEGEPE